MMIDDFYRHKHPHYGGPSLLDRILNLKAWREFNKENQWVQTWSEIWIRQLERDLSLQKAGLK
jgi:hypothetical protein